MSKRIFPVSKRAILSIDKISCSIRFKAVPVFCENFFTVSVLSGSASIISWYIIKAANGVFSWCEISEIVLFKNSFVLCSVSLLALSIVASCSTDANKWKRSPSLSCGKWQE